MRMNFDMNLTGLNNEQRKCNEKAELVLWKCMNKMEELAKHFVPVDTGRLKNSISLEPAFRGAREYTLSDGVDYGISIEYGTKPHYVPIAPLKSWSRRVLGDESAAYAVRAKIAERGVESSPYFRPSLHEVQFYWLRVFTKEVFT